MQYAKNIVMNQVNSVRIVVDAYRHGVVRVDQEQYQENVLIALANSVTSTRGFIKWAVTVMLKTKVARIKIGDEVIYRWEYPKQSLIN